jgi:uroporphyrin-3 C-methyltransferase
VDKKEPAPEFDPFSDDPPETAKPRASGGGKWLAALALLLALAVAGWNGWTWWQTQGEADTATDLQRALADIQEGQQSMIRAQREQAQRLEAVERLELSEGLSRLDEAVAQARSVAGSDRARLAGIESAQEESLARLDALEGRVAAVVVRGESPRQQLNLAEVDYLLRSANERLVLYGDARTADQALAIADEQLAALDDPVYLSVRQSIAAARRALGATERPDTIALTEGLAGLQAAIPGLPFPGEVVVRDDAGALETAEDPGVWARFKAAVSGLVSVRRQAEDASLVSLEDKDYVRQGLWLQLETARLALLREDDAAFGAALARAASTLEQYFDGDSAPVQSFADELGRLADVTLAVTWPDISAPWERLQAIRTVREAPVAAAEPAAAEPDTAAVAVDGPSRSEQPPEPSANDDRENDSESGEGRDVEGPGSS